MPRSWNVFELAPAVLAMRSLRSGQLLAISTMLSSATGDAAVATAGSALVMSETVLAAPKAVETAKMVPFGNCEAMGLPSWLVKRKTRLSAGCGWCYTSEGRRVGDAAARRW